MKLLKYFIDTHDHRTGTFPAGIGKPEFAAFFREFEKAARDEAVVVLRSHAGLADGRAFCFNAAADADALTTKRVGPRRSVLRRGDSADGAYLVVGGALRVFYVSAAGREATLYHVEPGRTCELGTAREVVYRALRALSARRLIQTARMQIRILDPGGLAAAAED